jgi:hypothetical protein
MCDHQRMNEPIGRWMWWLPSEDRVSVVRIYRDADGLRIESWFDRLDTDDPLHTVERVAEEDLDGWVASAEGLMENLGARLLLRWFAGDPEASER